LIVDGDFAGSLLFSGGRPVGGESQRSKPAAMTVTLDLVAHLVVDDGAEDDVRVLVGDAVD